jgi:hypothetical protein
VVSFKPQLLYTRGKKATGTHWIGGWVDLRAGLDDVEKRKFLTLTGFQIYPSVVQPVVSRYTDYAIPAYALPYILLIIRNIKNCG